ncbi:hypothetical protein [Chamaesiphon sp. VAR_48_metabat_403]|uniref:hypothetical protein n=1 Tax=Chamaesiphon sp. VAR_48_metabat_403 TaxID=2964700 RepID=UPI00286E5EF0|nr:hypothetical protein [Chamaesiphon sp. VAR_48_metabat_403]
MQTLKLSSKFSIHKRSIFLVLSIVISGSIQSCEAPNKRGAATPDRVVEQYLQSLETKDENLMSQLVSEDAILTKEIKTKIIKFGGYKIQNRKINYDKSTPMLWNAKLKGMYVDRQGKNKNFEDSIVLQYQSKGELKLYAGRWYLVLDGKI